MKKNIAKLLVIGAALLASEKNWACPDLWKSGFYGSGLIGFSRLKTNMKNIYDALPVGGQKEELRKSESAYKPSGAINLGYRHFFKHMAVGFDIGFSGGNINVRSSFRPSEYVEPGRLIEAKIRRLYAITPAVFLGYAARGNILIYGRLGMAVARFETQLRDTIRTQIHKRSQTKYVFSPTLGLEYGLSRHVSFCLQGTWEKFKGITHKNSGFSDPVLGRTATSENSADVTLMTYQMGFVYKV